MIDVLKAVETELATMPANVRNSGLAELTRSMAAAFERKPSALMAREIREALTQLRELAPAQPERDRVDELLARRTARRA